MISLSGNTLLVLKLHLTRKCNLPCLQCLAYSGPQQQDEIDPAAARRVIAEAAELGYNQVSLCGGEPLLYPWLKEVLGEARQRGLLTELSTNGLLLDDAAIAGLRPVLGGITVNLERAPKPGPAAAGSQFEVLSRNLAAVRAAGTPFSVRFTLTRANAGHLAWAAEFALRHGARMLEVRPLELTGGFRKLAALVPDGECAALGWLIADLVRRQHSRNLPVHFDMHDCERAGGIRFDAALPSPLVVETDGTVVPFRCGFPRAFALGRAGEARLGLLLKDWDERCGDVLEAVMQATLASLAETRPFPFVNLFDSLSEKARQATQIVVVGGRRLTRRQQETCCG